MQLVYRKCRNKLQRTGGQAAVRGAHLTWINPTAAPRAAMQQRSSGGSSRATAAARSAAAAGGQEAPGGSSSSRLRICLQRQASCRHHTCSRSRGRRRACCTQEEPVAGARFNNRSCKLVRVGSRMYHSTPQGLRCTGAAGAAAAVRGVPAGRAQLLQRAAAAAAAGGRLRRWQCAGQRCSSAQPAVAPPTAEAGTGALLLVPLLLLLLFVLWLQCAGGLAVLQLQPCQPAAAAAAGGAAKRLASSGAVARSLVLARARGRHAATRAAAKRGLCLHYCRHGKCDLALQRKCEKVHDPDKVAVCPHWLAGQCSGGSSCKLQHKVVPDLMPVCSYFLEVGLAWQQRKCLQVLPTACGSQPLQWLHRCLGCCEARCPWDGIRRRLCCHPRIFFWPIW
ncbi:hypothetical protein COO60DRAFT_488747 [Scenedesmus sp. NREL 46B-D3]|nr:hypothetical protein COO60DRAFT_488747 [Scenedesmus sp. NREL 46B-D3]